AVVHAVITNCIASSSVQSVETSSATGTISRYPEVGLGAVGTYTTASSCPLASSIRMRVTNPIVFICGDGKSIRTTRSIPSGLVWNAAMNNATIDRLDQRNALQQRLKPAQYASSKYASCRPAQEIKHHQREHHGNYIF